MKSIAWAEYLHLTFVGIALIFVFSSLLFSSLYLVQQWQLKTKKSVSLGFRVPSLEKLDRYVIRSLIGGFLSVTVLLFSGIILAHLVWKFDWTRDEKFIVAICTWVWFLLTIILRFQLGFRGEKFFYSILIAFFLFIASCVLAMVFR